MDGKLTAAAAANRMTNGAEKSHSLTQRRSMSELERTERDNDRSRSSWTQSVGFLKDQKAV
jgi:hypothetical protein